jgi:hypothetical protein
MIPKDIDLITNGWQSLVVLAIVTVPSIGGWVAAARIKHQSKPNSGNSMTDKLNRIESMLTDHIEADGRWKTQVEEMLTSRD